MTSVKQYGPFALLTLACLGIGCGESVTTATTSVLATPATVLTPQAPEAAKEGADPASPSPSPASDARAKPSATSAESKKSARLATALAALTIGLTPEEAEAEPVTLVPVTYQEFEARRKAKNGQTKYTLVDVWATTCGPCKENFPHLVALHHKYAGQGLAVASLTLDPTDDARALTDARKFLNSQKAVFPNYLMNEEEGVGYEKLNINAIPAVFLYGPDGKEIKRFTLDDPDNQFTYEQVEAYVSALLRGETKPK
ncbi:MAG: TlpA disulfide reductase family protein [Isosphaeraceae bacterium]